jgi:hypothetical protein
VRYYKQFHEWPYVNLMGPLCGFVCLVLALRWDDVAERVGFFVCAVFSFGVSWIIWKGKSHYLEIDGDWIIHQGFKVWRVRRTDLLRVERGRKGWVEEYDPYLKVCALDGEHMVDGGFLTGQRRIEELTQAMMDGAPP